jgi:hypothetical protein
MIRHIPLLSVQGITPVDGQRDGPKHVKFHFQNKFEKLVHLVDFIVRKFVTMHGHMNVKKKSTPSFRKKEYITLAACLLSNSSVTRASLVHVGTLGTLIIYCSLKPIFFKHIQPRAALVNLFCPNCC